MYNEISWLYLRINFFEGVMELNPLKGWKYAVETEEGFFFFVDAEEPMKTA